MSITSDLLRGHTEMIILARLMEHESYGYEINKKIQELSEGAFELKEATLYSAFRRLEEGGHIVSYWGNEETGARRRYYSITSSGRDFFRQGRLEWQKAKELIDTLIWQSVPEEFFLQQEEPADELPPKQDEQSLE